MNGGCTVENSRMWFAHLILFVAGQGVLILVGHSWLAGVLFGGVDATASSPPSLPLLGNLGRLWCIVFAIDTVWSLFSAMPSKKEK